MIKWNKIKYFLGLKSVINMNGKWYITKMFGFSAQDKYDGYWWHLRDCWPKYCAYDTKEEALSEINKFKINS